MTDIMDILEEKALQRKMNIPESLFVKNIENVQGDEKDIIIFSIGYAPDAKGRFTHQFGSLNVVNGENRLNVAVTRAREKVVVVSSILPPQLKVDNTKNEGPKLLKKYLEYALNVSDGHFVPNLNAPEKHRADWYLKHQIQAMASEMELNFNVLEELPFADLTLKKDGKYLGLILTDDELYHQAISVKDMHIYTPFALNGKHWKFRGFYSREFWHDPKLVQDRLLRLAQLAE